MSDLEPDTSSDACLDNSTDTFCSTPSTSIAGDPNEAERHDSQPPQPGYAYIIQSISCGRRITLSEGTVVFASPSSRGSANWMCIEENGWLGFRNCASNLFLGHDGYLSGGLRCTAKQYKKWEWVRVSPHKTYIGAYALCFEHEGGCRPLTTRKDQGLERLSRADSSREPGIAWNFIPVP